MTEYMCLIIHSAVQQTTIAHKASLLEKVTF